MFSSWQPDAAADGGAADGGTEPAPPPAATLDKGKGREVDDLPASWTLTDAGMQEPDGARQKPQNQPRTCLECRRLKLKCSRVFPCVACVRRGVEDLCPSGALQTNVNKKQLLETNESLRARIRALEEQLAASQLTDPAISPSGTSTSSAPTQSSASASGHTAEPPPPPPREDRRLGKKVKRSDGEAGSPDGDLHPLHVPFDVATAIAEHDPRWPHTHHVHRITGLPVGVDANWPYSAHPEGITFNILKAYLPPRGIVWTLSGQYFEQAGWHTNIVAARMYDPQYFTPCCTPGGSPTSQQLAIVYLVCAIGALFDPETVMQGNELARLCFQIGRASLALDMKPSLAVIQAIHLMGMYTLSTGQSDAAGEAFAPLLNVAMKTALSISLHRDGSHWSLSTTEVELRRTVFWEINSLDLHQSLATGRPRYLKDVRFDTEISEQATKDSIFFVYKYEILKMMAKVNDLQLQSTLPTLQVVMELDRALKKLQASVPAELYPGNSPLPPFAEQVLQRHTLDLMISVTQLFLHSNLFAQALRENPSTPLETPYAPSYKAMLEACKAYIRSVQSCLAVRPKVILSQWYYHFHVIEPCASLVAECIKNAGGAAHLDAKRMLEEGISAFRGSTHNGELALLEKLLERALQAIEVFQTTRGLPLMAGRRDSSIDAGKHRLHHGLHAAAAPGSVQTGPPLFPPSAPRLGDQTPTGRPFGNHLPAQMPLGHSLQGATASAAVVTTQMATSPTTATNGGGSAAVPPPFASGPGQIPDLTSAAAALSPDWSLDMLQPAPLIGGAEQTTPPTWPDMTSPDLNDLMYAPPPEMSGDLSSFISRQQTSPDDGFDYERFMRELGVTYES